MLKRIRTWAVVALHTLVAVFGTALLESPFARAFHPHTGFGVIWREWITSIVVAGALGFLVQRLWKSGGGKLSWILPSAVFLLGVFMNLGSGHAAGRFSGHDCAAELGGPGCRDFLMFTIPLVRGLSYSTAAVLARLMR
jgi:hypothetical protein